MLSCQPIPSGTALVRVSVIPGLHTACSGSISQPPSGVSRRGPPTSRRSPLPGQLVSGYAISIVQFGASLVRCDRICHAFLKINRINKNPRITGYFAEIRPREDL